MNHQDVFTTGPGRGPFSGKKNPQFFVGVGTFIFLLLFLTKSPALAVLTTAQETQTAVAATATAQAVTATATENIILSYTRTYTYTYTPTFTQTFTITPTPTILPCTSGISNFTDADLQGATLAGATSGTLNPTLANALTIEGGGVGVGGTNDQFHYHYTSLSGPGTIMALLNSTAGSGTPESGIMIRNGSNVFSAYAYLAMQNSGSVTFQWRTSDAVNASPATYITAQTLPQWLELIYDGTQVTAWTANAQWGVWQQVGGPVTITLGANQTWGLVATSNAQGSACTAVYNYFCVNPVIGTPTNTPTPGGGFPTATNTPQGSYTPTVTTTFTPTVTYTATPIPTEPPTPNPTQFACSTPVGGSNQTLMGTGGGASDYVYCFNNNCGPGFGPGSGSCNQLVSDTGVFGMSLGEVRNITDNYGTSLGANPVPLNIPGNWQLSYFSGNLTYGPSQPAPYQTLQGLGILVVDGDLTLQQGGKWVRPTTFRATGEGSSIAPAA